MNTNIDLNFGCKQATVSANTSRVVHAEIEEADKGEVLDHFGLEDIVDHFGEDKLLDHIGEDAVKKYFSLTEIKDEA